MADNVRHFNQERLDQIKAQFPDGDGLGIWIERTETSIVSPGGEILMTTNGIYDLVALWERIFPEANIDFDVGSDDEPDDEENF